MRWWMLPAGLVAVVIWAAKWTYDDQIRRFQRQADVMRRLLAGYRESRRLQLERIAPTPRYDEPMPDDLWRKLHGKDKP